MSKTDSGRSVLQTKGFLFFLPPSSLLKTPSVGLPIPAHLTCSVRIVGHVAAASVKHRRVSTETLFWLRLRGCGKGVRSEPPIPWVPELCSLSTGGGVTQAGAQVEGPLTQASGAAAGKGGPP